MNDILAKVQIKGINSMRIAALKNKDIVKYREQVKIEAMRPLSIRECKRGIG